MKLILEGECLYCDKCIEERKHSVSAQVITKIDCVECGKQMIFSSSDVDQFCSECSNLFGICCRCGIPLGLSE